MKKVFMAVAIGCAAVMALAGAGCGENDDRTTNSLDELKDKYGFQWEDPKKPILNETGAKELSFHVYSSKNASAKDYNEMDIMQTLYEQTNVYVQWENVSESIYGEQKVLKLGKHDGIDAIYHAGLTTNEILRYGVDRGALLAISDYLDYMPNFKAILDSRSDIKKQVTSIDGKIYALPRVEEMGLLQNPNLLFINKTWTEKAVNEGKVDLGGQKIEDGLELTSAQMENLLTYFKNNDMNGNGNANDERPLSFVWNNWQGNQCDLYGMFGLNDNLEHRVIKDGKVVYTVLDDAYKTATQFLHNWVANGLIDAVSFEQSQDQFLANGKGTGTDEKYGAFYWWESETVVSDPENYVCCKPLKGPNGAQTVCVSNNPEISMGEVIFFKGTPNVEVLLAYFDRYYMPEISAQINYGPIGIAFEEEKDNGKLVAKDPPAGKTTDELRLENAPLGLCYLSGDVWSTTVEMEPRAKLRLERLNKYATPYYDHNSVKPVPNLQFTKEELDVLARYQTTIDNYLRENIIKWLKDGLDDATWTAHKERAVSNAVGIGAVQEVYQAAYDRYVNEK